MKLECPTYGDLKRAAERLEGHARKTPLHSHPLIDKIAGANIYLKDETAQKTGSFKYRGARARMSLLSETEKRRGVVAFSSGNHAQGVALNARELGTHAVIVMPKTAPAKKKHGTKALGARIVEYDIATQSREALAEQIARDENRVLIPAFDDPLVIAGQGTCGLELMDQCKAQGFTPDMVIAPLGGGGLAAGVGLAARTRSPETKMFGAEPFDFDDHYRSLQTGKRETFPPGGQTICDALMSPRPGHLTLALNRHQLSGVFRVSDAEVLLAMRLAWETLGLKLEPGGAIALAAALNPANVANGMTVCVILSGGNVDENIFARALDSG